MALPLAADKAHALQQQAEAAETFQLRQLFHGTMQVHVLVHTARIQVTYKQLGTGSRFQNSAWACCQAPGVHL